MGNSACSGTCENIKSTWNIPNSPFKDYEIDVLDKCDICSRAGYCTIPQCSDQKKKILDLITNLVNSWNLTAKTDPVILPFVKNCGQEQITETQNINNDLARSFANNIGYSITIESSTQDMFPKIEHLFKNYLSDAAKVPDLKSHQLLANNETTEHPDLPADVFNYVKKTEENADKMTTAIDKLEGYMNNKPKENVPEDLESKLTKLEEELDANIKNLEEIERKLNELGLGVDEASIEEKVDLQKREEFNNKRKELKALEQATLHAKEIIVKNKKRVLKFR
jgi:hypothetical protein